MYRLAIDYLKEWKGRATRKPLIVRGARQVGKSTLVRMFAEAEFSNLVELNFEYDSADAAFFLGKEPSETVALLGAKYRVDIEPGNTLLFLDEIQAVPEVLATLRYFFECLPDLHVIAAGSLLDFALNEHTFSMPVGRVEYLHLGPMSFEEFLLATGRNQMVDYLLQYELGTELVLHDELMALVKQYCILGGMPEAIAAYAQGSGYRDIERIKQTLLTTFRDDFSKYGKRIKLPVLRKVFDDVPRMVGRKFVYSQVDRDVRGSDIKTAFEQLCLARVVHKILHSDAGGVPLGAEASERNFKALFLDIGLLCRVCGLSVVDFEAATDVTLINAGAVAEQFVGQHLLYAGEFFEEPSLFCWMRQKPSSNAEVDYLFTLGQTIVPVEVKAGTTGRLKSLHMFVQLKQREFAVRFNAAPPSLLDSQTGIAGTEPTSFRLLSLPFYLIGQTRRLCADVYRNGMILPTS